MRIAVPILTLVLFGSSAASGAVDCRKFVHKHDGSWKVVTTIQLRPGVDLCRGMRLETNASVNARWAKSNPPSHISGVDVAKEINEACGR